MVLPSKTVSRQSSIIFNIQRFVFVWKTQHDVGGKFQLAFEVDPSRSSQHQRISKPLEYFVTFRRLYCVTIVVCRIGDVVFGVFGARFGAHVFNVIPPTSGRKERQGNESFFEAAILMSDKRGTPAAEKHEDLEHADDGHHGSERDEEPNQADARTRHDEDEESC